ncbi:hypothetical protein Aph02nite_47790 [Actinoplanes philippinensis]|nr:hypothetical protein Aph02nite_47790 [Actinoplanes philippinensis]
MTKGADRQKRLRRYPGAARATDTKRHYAEVAGTLAHGDADRDPEGVSAMRWPARLPRVIGKTVRTGPRRAPGSGKVILVALVAARGVEFVRTAAQGAQGRDGAPAPGRHPDVRGHARDTVETERATWRMRTKLPHNRSWRTSASRPRPDSRRTPDISQVDNLYYVK